VANPDPARRRGPELTTLATQLLETLDEFSADVAEQIQARVDFYAEPSQVSTEDLRRSCRGNVEFVLRSMREEQLPDVSAAEQTGRRRAEQGVPLPYVMAAFRVGFSTIWQRVVDHARRGGTPSSDVLVDVASDVWTVHDTFAEAMASAYRDAAMAQVLRDERERSALVAALLEGRVLEDMTVWDIADLLRLPRRGPFVVVSAESLQVAQEALPDAEIRLRVRDIGSAWRLLPEIQVGIVRLPGELPGAGLRQLTGVLAETARGRVGVSPVYTLLTETVGALRLARIAMTTTAPGQPAVTLFDDHPLAVAAVSAPDAMQHIARTVLGAVLDLPPEQSTLLLQTLAAWRDNGGSATAAAQQMFCHPNTIRQRLRKLESCTGRSLSDPQATAELFLALQAVALLPPP
jgi:PucR C-terminal helix-turn-helix domain